MRDGVGSRTILARAGSFELARRVMCSLLALVVVSDLASADEDDDVVPGHVVLKLRAGQSIDALIARYATDWGTSVLEEIPGRRTYLLSVFEGDEEEFVDVLLVDPSVEIAEPDFTGRDTNPDPGTQSIFVAGTIEDYLGQPAMDIIRTDEAQRLTRGGGVVVAVIDSGVDATHPMLAGRVLDGGWNFIDGNADVRDVGDGMDNDGDGLVDESVGHGTLAAGLVVRVAPDAMILPYRVLDSDGFTTTFRMVSAMYAAIDSGAEIINISMGSTRETFVIRDAVIEALVSHVLIVASAGNESTSSPVRYPAALSSLGVLAIAATDDLDVRADFSNYGPHISMSAPGDPVTSTVPGGGYGTARGTSFGAPMVAGSAALVRSLWQFADRNTILARLISSSDPIDHVNDGYEGQLGAGRLDTLGALIDGGPGSRPIRGRTR